MYRMTCSPKSTLYEGWEAEEGEQDTDFGGRGEAGGFAKDGRDS